MPVPVPVLVLDRSIPRRSPCLLILEQRASAWAPAVRPCRSSTRDFPVAIHGVMSRCQVRRMGHAPPWSHVKILPAPGAGSDRDSRQPLSASADTLHSPAAGCPQLGATPNRAAGRRWGLSTGKDLWVSMHPGNAFCHCLAYIHIRTDCHR